MLTYFDLATSPNCLKTKIVLYEAGLPFAQRSVDAATVRGADYRAMFPTGYAPAIEDGDVRIGESAAIALYLAERHGVLTPRDPALRARMFQAISIEAAIVAPTTGGQGYFGELYKPEAERSARRLDELRQRAQWVAIVLGQVLGDRPYFAEEFSIADAQLYPAVAKSIEARVYDDPPTNLRAWHERMTARPAVARARAEYVAYRT